MAAAASSDGDEPGRDERAAIAIKGSLRGSTQRSGHGSLYRQVFDVLVPARTLLLYFLVLKIDIGLARRGGPDAVPEADRRGCLALLRQMLVGAGAVVWSQGHMVSWWTVCAGL